MPKPLYLYCPGCHWRVKWVSVKEAAGLTGLSRSTIYRNVQAGQVHARRMGGKGLLVCQHSLVGPDRSPVADLEIPIADSRVKLAKKLIEEQYNNPDFDLVKLARKMHLSAGHLSRLINKSTGASFREHLRAVRLEKAAELLLRERKLSIKEIAAAVGYRHPGDFARHFKTAYGERPRDYRRQRGKIAGQRDPRNAVRRAMV